jgi:hypothetical protein
MQVPASGALQHVSAFALVLGHAQLLKIQYK